MTNEPQDRESDWLSEHNDNSIARIVYTRLDDDYTSRLRHGATLLCKPIPNEEGLKQEPYLWNVPYDERYHNVG